MKKIKKIGGLVAIFLFNIYNTCFADVVMEPNAGHPAPLTRSPNPEFKGIVNYVLIGILVLVVVICAVIIIRRIIKKKKENENDNDNK